MIIKLRVGDPFDSNGHLVESNLSPREIDEAYSKGQEIVGIDIDLRTHFNSSDELTDEVYEALSYHININDLSDVFHISPSEWLGLYLKIAKLGNPEFEYSWADPLDYYIGGEALR